MFESLLRRKPLKQRRSGHCFVFIGYIKYDCLILVSQIWLELLILRSSSIEIGKAPPFTVFMTLLITLTIFFYFCKVFSYKIGQINTSCIFKFYIWLIDCWLLRKLNSSERYCFWLHPWAFIWLFMVIMFTFPCVVFYHDCNIVCSYFCYYVNYLLLWLFIILFFVNFIILHNDIIFLSDIWGHSTTEDGFYFSNLPTLYQVQIMANEEIFVDFQGLHK